MLPSSINQGYDKAQVFKDRNFVKVIFGKYTTKAEAQQALNALNDNAEFADAWVTNISVTE